MIRPVDLDADREALLGVLQRNLPDLPHARRFEWLYVNNPSGRPWSWFLSDADGSPPVGAASVFPRPVRVAGKVNLCGQVGDFAIDASHRSLGPAVALQRATFRLVDEGTLAFCYDCPPHDAGMATFWRLGKEASCQMVRYALPLRVDRLLRSRLGPGRLSATVARLGNVLVDAARGQPRGGVEIAVHQGQFDDEFTRLDESVSGRDAIRGRRHAEDLNWRYRQDPLRRYRVLTARRAGELVGFAVLLEEGEDAFVVDVFGESMPELGRDLVEAAAHIAKRESPAQTLHVLAGDGSRLRRALQQTWFRFRSPAARVVAYARPGGEMETAVKGVAWDLVHADVMA